MIKPETNDFFGNELDKAKLEIASYWKDKYEKTQKALDIAIDALTRCQNNTPDNYTAMQAVFLLAKNSVFIDKALEQITTLEQKD